MSGAPQPQPPVPPPVYAAVAPPPAPYPTYAPPPPYYPPPGYPPQAYPQMAYPFPQYVMKQPGQDSFQGLKLFRWGAIVVIVGGALSVIAYLMLYAAASSVASAFSNPGTLNMFTLLGAIQTVQAAEAFGALSVLVGLAGGIIGLVGAYFMFRGKNEFGADHAGAVARAAAPLAVCLIMYLGVILANVLFSFNGLNTTTFMMGMPSGAALMDQLVRAQLITGLASMIATLLTGFAMVAFISRLLTDSGRRMKNVFLALSIVAGVIPVAAGVILPALVGPVSVTPGPLGAMLDAARILLVAAGDLALLTAVSALVGLVAMVTFLPVVRSAEQGGQSLIAAGAAMQAPMAQAPVYAPPPV